MTNEKAVAKNLIIALWSHACRCRKNQKV